MQPCSLSRIVRNRNYCFLYIFSDFFLRRKEGTLQTFISVFKNSKEKKRGKYSRISLAK